MAGFNNENLNNINFPPAPTLRRETSADYHLTAQEQQARYNDENQARERGDNTDPLASLTIVNPSSKKDNKKSEKSRIGSSAEACTTPFKGRPGNDRQDPPAGADLISAR